MKNVAIYCGASKGFKDKYENAVKDLAKELASNNINVVYGAGNVGLMGVLANEILSLDGHITGIIPDFLMNAEVGHHQLSKLEIVDNMHIRKKRMIDLSEGFIAMPGGFGTLDEIFEVLTWEQLNLHFYPVAFYNVDGYFEDLFSFIQHAVDEGFIKQAYLDQIIISDEPQVLINRMKTHQSKSINQGKWVK